MDLELADVSIVVLSEGNNPSLLNQDFLERNGIVPADWNVKDVLVTPPFSRVIYENGVQFVVEINKLDVKTNKPNAIEWDKTIPGMTTAYLALLPHVTYRAVGINFLFAARVAQDRPLTRILQQGPWMACEGGLTGSTIELKYHKRVPQLNVKIAVHQGPGTGAGGDSSLVFTVNYHQEFAPDETEKRAEYIRSSGGLRYQFLDFAASLPFD